MNIEGIREYCLAKPGVTESLPFNDTVLVFKVMEKMFAFLDLSEDGIMNFPIPHSMRISRMPDL